MWEILPVPSQVTIDANPFGVISLPHDSTNIEWRYRCERPVDSGITCHIVALRVSSLGWSLGSSKYICISESLASGANGDKTARSLTTDQNDLSACLTKCRGCAGLRASRCAEKHQTKPSDHHEWQDSSCLVLMYFVLPMLRRTLQEVSIWDSASSCMVEMCSWNQQE